MSKKVSLSDEELVEKVREKDKELFRDVIERYEDKLLRYAGYLMGDHEAAADVVQDSFIKAYKNLWSFDVSRKFSSWIYRIVHNQAVNSMRKRKNEIQIESFDWVKGLRGEDKNVEEQLEKKEAEKMLADCMDKLPLKYSEPLTLYFIEEKKYEEISDILRIPLGTVGTRIKRGKMVLKRLCGKNGFKK